MARTTRSKKVELSEDNTALEASPLPHIGSQLQAVAGNAMPSETLSVESEIRDLKGAWREAIGEQRKSKKGNKKKKADAQQKSEPLGPQLPIPDDAPKRITRRQAQAQEGPYDLQNGGTLGRSRDFDLMSLIAGRSTGPRNPYFSAFEQGSGCAANDHLFLAEEALKKATILEVEPKELKDNTTNQYTAPNPSTPIACSDITAKSEEGVRDSDLSEQADVLGDSFVEQITSRSPAKPCYDSKESLEFLRSPSKALASVHSNYPNLPEDIRDSDQDSFVEHITSRSPVRIEDSVEALDQMEEVEEALSEMAERMTSPEKIRHKKEERIEKAPVPQISKRVPAKSGFQSQSLRVKPPPQRDSIIRKAASMTFKPAGFTEKSSDTKPAPTKRPISQLPPKESTTTIKPVKRPTSLLPPKDPAKSSKPVTRPTNFELPGEAIARKLKEQRERRLAQHESSEDSFHTARAFSGPSVKSKKPLTKPSFELPGEAYSRKKREAHEAKLKAQEEEDRKRREFKARPVRQSTSSKRSTISQRPSMKQLISMVANTSAPRAPGPVPPTATVERKPSVKFHGPSMSGLAMQRTVSATEVQLQRQRAKEIYNRDQKLAEDIERERKVREAAAKRSREEAAERGRQASREWAEKQRAKKLAEGDKGMSAGYGPGGQMGLV